MPDHDADAAILLPDMIGTTICAMPAVEAIGAAIPGARLRLFSFRRVGELLLDEPVAAGGLELLDLPELADQLRARLAALDAGGALPGLVFDFLSTPESEAVLAAACIRRRVGWANDLDEPGHTVAVPPPGERQQQSVQDYLDFAVAAGLQVPSWSAPTLTASAGTRAAARGWLAQQGVAGERLFVLGIGGGNDRKRWPLSRYLELGSWLQDREAGRPIFFAGPREAGVVEELRAALPAAIIAQSLPLDLAKGIVSLARLAVCNDHAIMHLAAALGVPTVGVFLASDPKEWFPYPAPSSHVIGPPLDCRPCYTEECAGWECNDPSLMQQVRSRLEALL